MIRGILTQNGLWKNKDGDMVHFGLKLNLIKIDLLLMQCELEDGFVRGRFTVHLVYARSVEIMRTSVCNQC
jgi:hypothetical protein